LDSQTTVVLDRDDMRRTLQRIAHEIVEKNPDGVLALVGIHRRGAHLAKRLHALTGELLDTEVPFGTVDIAFYRDDLGSRPAAPIVHSTELQFAVDGRTIVIVDDVLYTGRTVRAAIDVIFDFGRPAKVQLATLVDRGHRELPIRPDYVGKNIPTSTDQRVNVRVDEVDGIDEVTIASVSALRAVGGTQSDRTQSDGTQSDGTQSDGTPSRSAPA
jgi:pyrimidine operon attenuation protein / uracil phosphoribosyltransferase